MYISWDLRYFISHFRLEAAIFDLPLTQTWENIHTSSTVFLDLGNGGFRWKFADISFVSRDPSYIRSVGRRFEFVWRGI